ncbi:MAG: Ig-like domain-containing protein, partial [Candidatus Thorarchaeota archaeon]
TIAQQFMIVGDFVINATYSGYGLNGSATDVVPQRVYVTPNLEVIHDPSCIVGDAFEIRVGYIDALGNYIPGRTISITIEQNGATAFETTVSSAAVLVSIYWNPTEGGLATITILHPGGMYYLTNSTSTTTSIMEHVTGELWLTPSQVDLFESSTFVYNLTSGLRVGVNIHFEVLDMYLVPIWNSDVITNSSGMAEVVYAALESHGILRVNAGPTLEEFLLGGDVQKTLVVMTDVLISTSLAPSPPTVGTLSNITLWLTDELGVPIDGITSTVSLYDPYGEQVQLGYFTMSISVAVVEGLAVVEFTPSMVGLYTVIVSSSGSTSVHNFLETSYHTIFSDTQLTTTVSTHELEVGQTFVVASRLTDYRGLPLVGRNLTLTIDGPGANYIGPIELVTNATGHIEWSSTLDDEGLWILDISFSGLGVFLSADSTDDINVRYGTIIDLSLNDTGYVIAGTTPASLSILLSDTGGTPLEGFTLHYEAHHETLGLMLEGYLIQTGTESMVLNITLDRMGNYTIIVSFAGTSHYHPSNAAIEQWVFGVTEVSAVLPTEVDRALSSPTPIAILDELMIPIPLSDLNIFIELIGPAGPVNLTSHLTWIQISISFNTMGLPVGLYELNVTIGWSETRVGCTSLIEFAVVSTTHVEITNENLTGFISEPHSMTFILQDSLNETIVSATVWVSIFNPSGREIFGSPLTDRTAISSSTEGSEVSWNPTLTGVYRVVLLFEGDAYLNSTTLEVLIEVRYPSSLIVNMPQLMEFGEIIPISATLSGALGRIGGATLILTITQDGVVERQETLTTNSQGVASFNLAGLLSGNHTITISYTGSATQAVSMIEMSLVVTPIVILEIESTSNLYLGYYCTVNMTVTVFGTKSEWRGTLDARLIDPHGDEVGQWNIEIGMISALTIGFNARLEGTYILNATISGLPVIYSQDYPMGVTVVNEKLQLQLDAGTTPLIGGFGVLAAIGVVLRKKMKGIKGTFPSEWSE